METSMNAISRFSRREALVSQFLKIFPSRLFLMLILAMMAGNAFGQTFSTIYNFGAVPHDGAAPGSGVVIDRSGNLFGATGVGGFRGSDGTVFELTPPTVVGGAWTETVLRRFWGSPDGKIPLGRLVMTSDDALFGTTLRGGVNDLGTVYTVALKSPGVWRKGTIYSFGSVPNDVVTPDLGLLASSEGFYSSDQGGANNTGAIYLLTPPTKEIVWTQNILYSFQSLGSGDAADPSGELVRDSRGNFYGVTAQGGVNNLGAVFEVSPPVVPGNPWTEAVLHSFNGADGTLPAGRLLLGAGGELYGTASSGGTGGAGLVFRLDPPAVAGNPWTETILHAFSGSDGSSPENGVIADKLGRLFGAAADTIFMLHPPVNGGVAWKETILHTFTGPDGFTATTPLTLSKKVLYGTTSQAGAFGKGTVFQIALP
jgi:uncharacterized repeat protein (TIGR03803 family)